MRMGGQPIAVFELGDIELNEAMTVFASGRDERRWLCYAAWTTIDLDVPSLNEGQSTGVTATGPWDHEQGYAYDSG